MSKQRREVSISVCHPVMVRVTVERDEDGDGEWSIVGVRQAICCETSARSVTESLSESDWEELDLRANSAKDLP